MAETKKNDAGVAEVQSRFAKEQEQGFVGEKVDPTPNENYTVAGVTSGKPTPETDREHYLGVQSELDKRSRGKS